MYRNTINHRNWRESPNLSLLVSMYGSGSQGPSRSSDVESSNSELFASGQKEIIFWITPIMLCFAYKEASYKADGDRYLSTYREGTCREIKGKLSVGSRVLYPGEGISAARKDMINPSKNRPVGYRYFELCQGSGRCGTSSVDAITLQG